MRIKTWRELGYPDSLRYMRALPDERLIDDEIAR
jgi:hypothetical protein